MHSNIWLQFRTLRSIVLSFCPIQFGKRFSLSTASCVATSQRIEVNGEKAKPWDVDVSRLCEDSSLFWDVRCWMRVHQTFAILRQLVKHHLKPTYYSNFEVLWRVRNSVSETFCIKAFRDFRASRNEKNCIGSARNVNQPASNFWRVRSFTTDEKGRIRWSRFSFCLEGNSSSRLLWSVVFHGFSNQHQANARAVP